MDEAGLYGTRVAVLHDDLRNLSLPPYITTTLISEQSDVVFQPLLQTLRPYGGMAVGGHIGKATLQEIELGNFALEAKRIADLAVVRRVGPLPGWRSIREIFRSAKTSWCGFRWVCCGLTTHWLTSSVRPSQSSTGTQ